MKNINNLNSTECTKTTTKLSQPHSSRFHMKENGSSWFVFLCSFLISFTGFVFGWDTGTISGFINMDDFVKRFGQQTLSGYYELSRVRSGLIVSIFNIGCTIGGVTLPKFADLFGRKAGLVISMFVYIIGCIIQITSRISWVQYFIGRIVTGLAIGSNCVIAPLFLSEISPKDIRGSVVSVFQLLTTMGMFLGYCACYGTYHNSTGSYQWELPLGLCFLWASLAIIGIIICPESPRYLAKKGLIGKAKQSFSKMKRCTIDSPEVTSEIISLQKSICEENAAGTSSWKELIIGKPLILYRVTMGVLLETLQELTGDNYLFYYGTTIFKSVGLNDSFFTSIIIGAVNFISTFLAFYAIDHIGRRNTLLIGSAGMFCCLIIYASIGVKLLYPGKFGIDPVKSVGDAMIFLCCLFIFFFAITWGPSLYVIVGESYPLRIRSKAMGITIGSNWFWNFLIAFFTPFITSAIHFAYGYVFAGATVFAFIFVYLFVPETKGMHLEDTDLMYQHLKFGSAYKARTLYEKLEGSQILEK